MKKNILLLVIFFVVPVLSFAQGYNSSNDALGKFVMRMYKASPFEGVKLLEDYDNQYLLSVVVLDSAKYGNNESTMTRVASVKATSEASRFFNGSRITMNLIITTKDDGKSNLTPEVLEEINEKSVGYVKMLSLLTSFGSEQGKHVFVYYKQIDTQKKSKKKKS